jgi:hypothetical protein
MRRQLLGAKRARGPAALGAVARLVAKAARGAPHVGDPVAEVGAGHPTAGGIAGSDVLRIAGFGAERGVPPPSQLLFWLTGGRAGT